MIVFNGFYSWFLIDFLPQGNPINGYLCSEKCLQ